MLELVLAILCHWLDEIIFHHFLDRFDDNIFDVHRKKLHLRS